MWNYISDEDLAAELGCDPDDFYEEFNRRFQLYVWCGLIEALSPRPGETQLRYRLTASGMEGAGREPFIVDMPYLRELGAYSGAAWTAPEYADLEWAAEMFPHEAVHYLQRRRKDRRKAWKAALKAGVKKSDVQGSESRRGGIARYFTDVGGNDIRRHNLHALRLAAAQGHKNAAIHRGRAAKNNDARRRRRGSEAHAREEDGTQDRTRR